MDALTQVDSDPIEEAYAIKFVWVDHSSSVRIYWLPVHDPILV